MPLQGALVLAVFEVPQLHRPVFGCARDLSVLRVEGQAGDVRAVTFEGVLGWRLGEECFFCANFLLRGAAAVGELLLEGLDLVLEGVDLALQGDDAFESELELLAIGIDFAGEPNFLCESRGAGGVAVVSQILDDFFVELQRLRLRQNHS